MASSPKTAARRLHWKNEILQIIRSTPAAGRTLIKQESNLSMESTLSLINELMEEGLVVTTGVAESRGAGRKATLLSIAQDGCFFLGLRFNASVAVAVLMNFGLQVVASAQQSFLPSATKEDILSGLFGCADRLLAGLGNNRNRLRGIGVGAPGLIDRERGVILRYSHVEGFENIALSKMLSQRYNVPVFLEHGVKCASRAILTLPQLAGVQNLLFFQIGRGASLSAIIGGKVYNGAHYLAGEIGQMRCGGETLEKRLNAEVLLKRYNDAASIHLPDADALFASADRGDETAYSIIAEAAEACAQAASNAVMVTDPEAVVFSSTYCTCHCFCQAVGDKLKQCLMPEVFLNLTLHFLPHDAVLDGAGAAMLPYHHHFAIQK